MHLSSFLVRTLRVLLVLLVAIFVFVEVEALSGQLLRQDGIARVVEGAEVSAIAVLVLVSVCVQVVIVCAWRLLGLIQSGEIFSHSAMGWVNAIVAATAVAWCSITVVFVLACVGIGDPVWALVTGLSAMLAAVCTLLMVVMRALLVGATDLRTDMEAVI